MMVEVVATPPQAAQAYRQTTSVTSSQLQRKLGLTGKQISINLPAITPQPTHMYY